MGTGNYYELSSAICGVWGGGSALRGPEGIVMWQLLLFRATNSNLLRSAKFSVVSQRLCAGVRGCAGVCASIGVNPFGRWYGTVGLSKVHLPWLRHRNILEACNDNISSQRQRPLQPVLSHLPPPLCWLGSAAARGGFGIWEAAPAAAALGCCYFHFAAMMKL